MSKLQLNPDLAVESFEIPAPEAPAGTVQGFGMKVPCPVDGPSAASVGYTGCPLCKPATEVLD